VLSYSKTNPTQLIREINEALKEFHKLAKITRVPSISRLPGSFRANKKGKSTTKVLGSGVQLHHLMRVFGALVHGRVEPEYMRALCAWQGRALLFPRA
jgi:hypothetical protein